jgi:orotidine 5'-phosphate decarboxylase
MNEQIVFTLQKMRRITMAFDRLIENIVKMQNPTVAGLDPKLDYVPESIKTKCFEKYGKTLEGAAAALFEFNKALIDALYDIVPAVKPQAAYYEMYGWQGVKALCDTIAYAKSKGMFVITDGKRNDIGTTMEAYATAHLGHTDVAGESIDAFGADALTVNGYLGTDGIKPLAKICDSDDKGIFVLVKTSNPSSGELQDMKLETNESVYEHMGKMCEGWGEDLMGKHGYSAVGAVVGATYPEQLGEMRTKLPHTFFLVPGYGAQGGGADDVKNAFDENGLGAIINSSRGIMCAWKKQGLTEDDFAVAARKEAERMRDEIVGCIGKIKLG